MVLISCGGDSKQKSNLNNPDAGLKPGIKSTSNIDYTKENEFARNTMDFRLKEEPKAAAAMTINIWHYEFLFDGKTMNAPQPHDGHWVLFKDDHTYEYGFYEDKMGSGRYHYSITSGLLLMADDDYTKRPEEYEVKLSGDVLVLVGQANYETNSRQAKLNRGEYLPTRQ